MNSSNILLLNYLNKWYDENPKNLDILVDIVSQNNKVSLRILDWFVTNYSKDYNITLDDGGGGVYEDYKLMLWSYKKKRFDPFCRDFKTKYHYTDTKGNVQIIDTSCGQLCFFKWCFEKNIIKYVKKHYDNIETDMKSKSSKSKSKGEKQQTVSVTSSKSIKKSSNTKHIITFR